MCYGAHIQALKKLLYSVYYVVMVETPHNFYFLVYFRKKEKFTEVPQLGEIKSPHGGLWRRNLQKIPTIHVQEAANTFSLYTIVDFVPEDG